MFVRGEGKERSARTIACDRREESNPTEVDAENGDTATTQEARATEQGAVTAERNEKVDGIRIDLRERRMRQCCKGRISGKRPSPLRRKFHCIDDRRFESGVPRVPNESDAHVAAQPTFAAGIAARTFAAIPVAVRPWCAS